MKAQNELFTFLFINLKFILMKQNLTQLFRLFGAALLLLITGNSAMAQTNSHGSDAFEREMAYRKAHPYGVWHRMGETTKNGKRPISSKKVKPYIKLAAEAEEPVTLYGILTFKWDWVWNGKEEYGLYSFNTSGDCTVNPVYLDNDFEATGGGAYYENTLCFTRVEYDYYGDNFYNTRLLTYDTDTWKQLSDTFVKDATYMASDMTYDPTTGMIYGCFSNADASDYEFSMMDPKTKELTMINNESLSGMKRLVCIACNSQGELYGVDLNGDLYQIDKETGETTLIGPTDITPSNYLQAATFDPNTGKMYWAAVDADEYSYLCELNLETGTATVLGEFADGEEFAGLYIPEKPKSDKVPAEAQNTALNFEGDALTGNISFSIPDKTYGGEALSGNVNYTVKVNDAEAAKGTAAPGATVKEDITAVAGLNKFDIVLSNDEGESPMTRIRKWIGPDSPKAVTDLNVKIDNFVSTVTWTAPTEGLNEGYVNPDEIEYTIVRNPGNITVAENHKGNTFTETIPEADFTGYTYTVTPSYKGLTGESKTSDLILFGNSFAVPYYEDFSDSSHFEYFKTYDNNNDDWTWTRIEEENNNQMRFIYTKDGDDWLVSPAIALKGDRNYKLSVNIERLNRKCKPYLEGNLDIYAGTGDDYTKYKKIDMDSVSVDTDTWITLIQGIITPEGDGDYHIAFYAGGPEDAFYLGLTDFGIVENHMLAAPAEVTGLSIKAGEKGALKSDITFKAPQTTIEGKTLAAIEGIDVYRDDKLVKTLTAQPGENISYVDEDGMAAGFHTYKIVPRNDKGEGTETYDTLYVGTDIAEAPANVKARVNLNEMTLTWDIPENGVNGGYIDPEAITYDIIDSDGNEIATGVKDNTYKFSVDQSGSQHAVQYGVIPVSAGGKGQNGASNIIILGEEYTLPFQENFAEGFAAYNMWWTLSNSNADYESYIIDEISSDDDGYCMMTDIWEATEVMVNTGKISLEGSNSPELKFNYYTDNSMTLTIEAETNTGEIVTLKTISTTASEEFTEETVSLNDVKDASYVVIRFHATDIPEYTSLALDDISVKDSEGTGVSGIAADEGSIKEIYSVDGKKLSTEHSMKKGLYIIKKGNKVEKITVK